MLRPILAAGLATAVGTAALGLVRAAPPPPDPKLTEASLRITCGTSCHVLPAPDVLPRAAWRASIEKMALIRDNRDIPEWGARVRSLPLPADIEAALRYYEARAPVALPSPEPWPAPDGRLTFVRRGLRFEGAVTPEPGVANVRLRDLDGDSRLEVIVSDMRHGVVLVGRPYEAAGALTPLAQVPNPSHAEVADLDGDGRKDLLVADLGAFLPGDHTKGAVAWLRARPEGGHANYSLDGFPRVADASAADFDGDGKLDVAVAAFGWRRAGQVAVLLNRTVGPSPPAFDRATIDPRPGAIHVIPTDLDGDKRTDIVALVAQQYEQVVAYLNSGDGRTFRTETLYAAPHPNWGSSGIELVDFDRDGDVDVLMTNGDMFDDRLLKPYHGVQWLENRGTRPFVPHALAQLPGAHRAQATDLDGDGDLDVVACAFTAGALGGVEARLPSLVWLEQVRPGRFERRTLELGQPTHATLDAGDFDADGDVDLVTGVFVMGGGAPAWVDVWENTTARRPSR